MISLNRSADKNRESVSLENQLFDCLRVCVHDVIAAQQQKNPSQIILSVIDYCEVVDAIMCARFNGLIRKI